MDVGQYIKPIVSDIFKACGCLLIIMALFLGINSSEIIRPVLLWQIIVLSAAFALFKVAYTNPLDLTGKRQVIVFSLCTLLADILIVLWLFMISPNTDSSIILAYIVVIFIVKGVVFAMMYIDGEKEARQINEKLSEYKNNTEK
ncbi:Protein of unknown function [Propionispora hippei DSM 15287]|uniref:DUF3021 family protein n=2 Tax=Propionispora TaxID=112902 RepID=A0A1M6DVF7_9FIRM|nr:Protein of unknown function [Propionispora hippei DSM 15287]